MHTHLRMMQKYFMIQRMCGRVMAKNIFNKKSIWDDFCCFFSSPEAERQKGEKDEFCYAERTKKDGSCCRRRKTASFFEKILEEGTEVVLRKLIKHITEMRWRRNEMG